MIETRAYMRKTFAVDAVQVTEDNILKVAVWCGGTVAKTLADNPMVYIHLENVNLSYKRRTKAYIGDWILVSSTGFKIYQDKAFTGVFEPVQLSTEQKYAKVHQLVAAAMNKQDAATYHGESNRGVDEIRDQITKGILAIFA